MAENEFERKVNGLMDDFKIAPSETVWTNVEKEIGQKRRRRAFAWMIFCCLLLTVTGGYFFINRYAVTGTEKPGISAGQELIGLTGQDKKNKLSDKEPSPEVAVADSLNTISNNTTAAENPTLGYHARPVQSGTHKTFDHLAANKKNEPGMPLPAAALNSVGKQQISATLDAPGPEIPSGVGQQDAKNNNAAMNVDQPNVLVPQILTGDNAKSPVVLTNRTLAADADTAKKTVSKKATGKTAKIQWGINAFFGKADVVQNIFNVSADKSALQNSTGGLSSGGIQIPYTIDAPRAGASFSIGITANKNLSGRSSMSAAINYSAQKTTINTGNRVDSSRLFYNAVVPSFTRDFYRVPSDSTGRGTYNNHYQFIQLPVLFNYQFNKSRKLPLYLNAGMAASVMLNSKSLVFDKTYAAFYSDNTLYKKFQLSIVTGITAKINFNHSYIIFGPQIQYSTTNLLKNKDYFGKQHLLNYGISTSFFLNKK